MRLRLYVAALPMKVLDLIGIWAQSGSLNLGLPKHCSEQGLQVDVEWSSEWYDPFGHKGEIY